MTRASLPEKRKGGHGDSGRKNFKSFSIKMWGLSQEALIYKHLYRISSRIYHQFTTFEKISCERKERVLICPRNPASRHNYHTIPYNVRRGNAV